MSGQAGMGDYVWIKFYPIIDERVQSVYLMLGHVDI